MSQPANGLDDPDYAAFAWRRYRQLMKWMTLVALACAGVAIWVLTIWVGPLPLHAIIATVLGVTFTILMAAALMGLVFLSSGTGHDEAVDHADLGEDAKIWREDA